MRHELDAFLSDHYIDVTLRGDFVCVRMDSRRAEPTMSGLNEIQYWHNYQAGQNNKCAKILAGNIPCGGGRNQHPEEPELPTGVDRDLEWDATHEGSGSNRHSYTSGQSEDDQEDRTDS